MVRVGCRGATDVRAMAVRVLCPPENKASLSSHDAPSPLSIKDGMDDDTLDVVKKHVKKDVNMFKHVMNERYGGVQSLQLMKKQQMLIKEGNTKRVKNIVKVHLAKEDAMLKWNMKQSLIRTTNDVSAKLKAVRFATAVVAKLDAKSC